MPTYAIRELTQEFEVTARTLRFYEDKGLLTPIRQGVTRIYSEKDRVRLELTLRGKRLGFSLDEIKDIIEMYDPDQPGDATQLLYLCTKIRKHRKKLINKINDIKEIFNLMDDIERRVFTALAEQFRAAAAR